MSALTKFTCATEKSAVVDLDGGALRAAVENVPLPRSGLVLEGPGRQFIHRHSGCLGALVMSTGIIRDSKHRRIRT